MSAITVIPTIEPQSGGFLLRVKSVDAHRAWRKWYGSERDAYEDAIDIGLACNEFFGSVNRRSLEPKVSIEIGRLERFGLRETSF